MADVDPGSGTADPATVDPGAGADDAAAAAAAEAAKAGGTWRDALPEDMRDHPTLASLADVPALAKEHINAQKAIGLKGIAVPADGAGDEDWARFDEAVATAVRPKEASDYKINVADGVTFTDADKAWHAAVLPAVHKAGLSQRQFDVVVAGHQEFMTGLTAEVEKATTKALGALKTKWGDQYDARQDGAKQAARALGLDAAGEDALERAFGSARVVELFDAIQQRVGADTLAPGGGGGPGGMPTTASGAKAEIERIKGAAASDPKHPYRDKRHPEHAALQTKMLALYQVAHPGVEGVM